jgi:site-specific recombinase XerD
MTQVRPASVDREVAFLKRVFNVAIDDSLADANPVRKVKLLRENNARVRYLTDDEQARLRAEMDEAQWAVVAIALNTGLRRAEQFSLTWEHVDFNTNLRAARDHASPK